MSFFFFQKWVFVFVRFFFVIGNVWINWFLCPFDDSSFITELAMCSEVHFLVWIWWKPKMAKCCWISSYFRTSRVSLAERVTLSKRERFWEIPLNNKNPHIKQGRGPAEAAIFPSVFSISAIAPDRWDDNPKLLAQRRNNDAGFNTSVAWSW